ncbi:MAG: HEAT repeat domain-containing protein, partial [Phycisphaeraceae bacterium]|nr:HEAT repeat domain-containing protein [Phycisphaeraceae bacterium]
RAVNLQATKRPKGTQLPSSDEIAPLVKLIKEEPNEAIRATAVTALGQVRAYREMDTFLELLDDESPVFRNRAYAAFMKVYGAAPAFNPSGPPAMRRDALRDLKELAPGLMKNAENYYTSGLYRPTGTKKKS